MEVDMIPEVREELVCHHWVYISLHFINEDGVDNREEQVGVQPDPDEEDIEDVVLDDERECNWRMVFEDNNGGVDDTKSVIHAKEQDVYNLEKQALKKGRYSVEVSDEDMKKVI